MECHFSNHSHDAVPPTSQPQRKRQRLWQESSVPTVLSRDNVTETSVSPQEQLLHHAQESVDGDTLSADTSHKTSPAATRFLDDGKGKGKMIFLGESATLAFVEVVRRVVEDSIGPCAFTTDPRRSSMLEARQGEEGNPMTLWTRSHIPTLSVAEVSSLVACYHTTSHGIFDLFAPQTLTGEIVSWALQGCSDSDEKVLIFLLVLAVGAQERGQKGDEEIADLCFQRAQQLAFCSLCDETSLLTVQSHILMAMYMLNACRRNGAFLNLGIAARAACALGLHRTDSKSLFAPEEYRARARAWKTLRVLDMFTSVSLGRPPATVESGSTHLWGGKTSALSLEEQVECACVRLCHITERIMEEVYHRDTVCAERVESISQHIREWASDFPALFEMDDGAEDEFDPASLPRRLCLSHLTGAYYYGIILLTKTYLVQEVHSLIQKRSTDNTINPDLADSSSPYATFVVPCISSAVKAIDIAAHLTNYPTIPKRIFLVVNNVFISALVLGLAYFGDYDRSFPLEEGLDKADHFLRLTALHDPHAQRYSEIVSFLRSATEVYVKQRDALKGLKRKMYIDKMFGTLVGKWSASQTLASGDDVSVTRRKNFGTSPETRERAEGTSPLPHRDISSYLQPNNLWPLQSGDTRAETLDQDLNIFSQSLHDLGQLPVDTLSPFSHFVELSMEHCRPLESATALNAFELV
jgi:hypothetical protein